MLKTKEDSVCCPPLARHGVNLCPYEHYPKGYRLFSCTFTGRFPFSFPFTGQKRCLTAQPPDTFSINFSMWSALLFFISSVTCP